MNPEQPSLMRPSMNAIRIPAYLAVSIEQAVRHNAALPTEIANYQIILWNSLLVENEIIKDGLWF